MKRILKYASRYWYLYVISIVAMVISAVLDMLTPIVISKIIDDVIIAKQAEIFVRLLLSLVLIGLGRAVFGYVKEYLFDISSTKIACDVRKDLFTHIQTLSLRFFNKNSTGELMARVKDDVDRIWAAVGYVIMLIIEVVIYCVLVLGFMFSISPLLTLIPLCIMPIVAIMAFKMERKLGGVYEQISEENAELTTVAQENLAGVRTVKAFAREKYEVGKFLKHNQKYYELNMKQAKTVAKYNPNIQFLSNMLIVLVIIFGGILVINGEITLGKLGAFSEYSYNIVWPMEILAWLCNDLAAAVASNKKIDKIMKEVPEIKSPPIPVVKEKVEGRLSFQNVSFSIDKTPILKEISFSLDKGKTLGIMGNTGSGKSSIVNLIERFHDVDSGEILLDGVNIKEYDLKQLRASCAIVMQDVFLFSDSIEENIKIGNREEMDKKEMIMAAEYASARNFIEGMSEKYQTIIGERGVGLSGGQKQRISIARALAKNAPLLIFDDSTSALDMETEFMIQKALANINRVTKIIIGHRISAVKDADEIIVLEQGAIAERGTHKELLSQKGLYYRTYVAQYGDYGLNDNIEFGQI